MNNRKQTITLLSVLLSLLISSGLLSAIDVSCSFQGNNTRTSITNDIFCQRVHASNSLGKKPVKATATIGLDPRTLRLVNQGKWKEAAERLERLSTLDGSCTRNHAWLAFAYLFLNRCDDLKKLTEKIRGAQTSQAGTTASDAELATKIVEIFDLTCAGKYEEASSLAAAIENANSKDVLLSLCLAAISAKRGNAIAAATYCNKVVELAPNFAWGYRTLGFIQERALKDLDQAEVSYENALLYEPKFPEVTDFLVDLRLSRNNFDGALDAAYTAVKASPRDARSYYRLTQIYIQQWRLKEALKQLAVAINLEPNNPRFHRSKAGILRYQKHFHEAIAEQQKACDLSPDKAFELCELAALYELAGNSSRAIASLAEAIKFSPGNQDAHYKMVQLLLKEKRFSDLEQEYRRALVLKPKEAALHLGLADALMQLDKIDEAIGSLKEAANLDHKDPRPHRQLGSIYIKRKNFSAAAKEYTRALNINPSSTEDLVALGYCYAENDDYMQAETAFVTALALWQLTQSGNPAAPVSRSDVMRALGALLLTEGRYAEAVQNFEAVIASSKAEQVRQQDKFLACQAKALRDCTAGATKEFVNCYHSLSPAVKGENAIFYVESLLKLGRTDLALAELARLPEQEFNNNSSYLTMLAKAHRQKGQLAKAFELAKKAVAVDGDKDRFSQAYLELALVQLESNDLQAAEEAARKALELDPKSFASYECLGRVQLKKSNIPQVLEFSKQAWEINPYYAPAYLLAGDAYTASGKFSDALNNYKKASELYPSWLEAHRSLRDTYKKLAKKEDVDREENVIAQMEKTREEVIK